MAIFGNDSGAAPGVVRQGREVTYPDFLFAHRG